MAPRRTARGIGPTFGPIILAVMAACNSRALVAGRADAEGSDVASEAAAADAEPAGAVSPGLRASDAGVLVGDDAGPAPPGRVCADTAACNWWQEPDPRVSCCGGGCTNTATDPDNCGACGHRCAASEVCTDGACGVAAASCGSAPCGGGNICCGGQCVRPYNNRNNCGGCGVTCTFTGAGCHLGVCCAADDATAACRSSTCADGLVLCSDGCRDVGSDPRHCGACDRACPATLPRCAAGLCRTAE
ncbi:MAG: Tryptophan synthase alpha chain [Myxococcales bacterium]|nr:Tryptophan synthase alpha chain [Myxococcales bacterium]